MERVGESNVSTVRKEMNSGSVAQIAKSVAKHDDAMAATGHHQ